MIPQSPILAAIKKKKKEADGKILDVSARCSRSIRSEKASSPPHLPRHGPKPEGEKKKKKGKSREDQAQL